MTRGGRIGLAALVVAGAGQAAGAAFDLNQPVLHNLAGVLGVVPLPVGTVLISRALTREPEWSGAGRPLRWSAHLTWISVVLFGVSFPLMMATFVLALGALPSAPPRELPHGVIAIVGWTGRLVIVAAWAWVSVTAWQAIKLQRRANESKVAPGPVNRTARDMEAVAD
ncbi:MAG: hypothetical protein J2P45_13550 [Candidatus Dormibacteraeota bacterium]|nr:hypothetical protein [Candidatus Dormibacteraeota bacterium]